jgi:DNA-binding response OmpR family regulator
MYGRPAPAAVAVAAAVERPALLFVDSEPTLQLLAPALRSGFALTTHSDVAAAREALRRIQPALLTVNADMMGTAAGDFCRAAKALACRPTVLVTTDSVENVPGLLAAGCDEVLLKPYAPQLLYTRIRRLLRSPRSTTRPSTCPHCGQHAATRFEFASHRRAWYACLACSQIWLAKAL